MINLNGKQYEVKFTRTPEPVTFYVKGKQRQKNTMATYCDLIGPDDPKPIARGRVTQSHKDVYNRRKATEAAFAAMVATLSCDGAHEPQELDDKGHCNTCRIIRMVVAQQFFAPKPKQPTIEGGHV